MIRIYITIPNGDGWIHKLAHFAICKILSDRRYILRHDCPTHQPYTQNLHKCMWDFIKGGEDFWLSFDADNPPINNPLNLIEYNCDLIGLPTPVWYNAISGDRPYYFNALDKYEDGYRPHEVMDGLQEVDAIGSGCFIVARRVIEALKYDQPFARIWNKEGLIELGGDYSFCRKVKMAGFKIWAHYGYPCYHFNEINLLEVISTFNGIK